MAKYVFAYNRKYRINIDNFKYTFIFNNRIAVGPNYYATYKVLN